MFFIGYPNQWISHLILHDHKPVGPRLFIWYSQLTLISKGLSPIRHLGTRSVGDGSSPKWESSIMVKQELSDEIITFMDMKSDDTSAISSSEGFSTVKDKYLEETRPFLALEDKNLDKTKPLFNLEEMKQDNPTLFSSSEDMKPNLSTAFSIFEDKKPEILTISSLESEKQNGFKAQQQLSSPPDSTDFKENFAVLKSDLQNELKELKLLHTKLIDNLPKEYLISNKGLKTYKCDMCCQRFFHFDHVKQHINIHTRVNPYGHDFRQQEVVMISQGEQINKTNLEQTIHTKEEKLHGKNWYHESP
ncbi:zinc finger protein 655-like [Physella acuta]|uniref:zinc finger protein 655-like n=1 Tax=Physella acuta TaxID=109671 RepID=UPI0027DBF7BC|nr:zinc finger protein 655-like [Physella acuta]